MGGIFSTGYRPEDHYDQPVIYLWFAIISFIWGSSFILMKYAGQAYGPLTIGGFRMLGGAATLGLVWLIFYRHSRWPLRWHHLPWLIVIGIVALSWSNYVQPAMIERYGESGFFGIMPTFVPLFTLFTTIILLREMPNWQQWVGVIGGLFFLLMLADDGIVNRKIVWYHVLMGLSVPVGYAVANTLIKKYFMDASPVALGLGSLSVASLILLSLTFTLESQATTQPTVDAMTMWVAIACIAALGILGMGVANTIFYSLIQKHGPVSASTVTYLMPLFVVGWGWVDGEAVTIQQIIALLGILGMIALVQHPTPNPPNTSTTRTH